MDAEIEPKGVVEKRVYGETVDALTRFFGSKVYAARFLGITLETFNKRLNRWPQLRLLLRDGRGHSAKIQRAGNGQSPYKEISMDHPRFSIQKMIEAEVEKAKKTYSYRLASPKERAEILERHRTKYDRESDVA